MSRGPPFDGASCDQLFFPINGKAVGPDEIPAEVIKTDMKTAVNMLHSLLTKAGHIKKEEVPAQWRNIFCEAVIIS